MSISWPPIASISSRTICDDALVHPPAGRQPRPQAGADLADEAGADHQLVRQRLGVGGRLALGGQQKLG